VLQKRVSSFGRNQGPIVSFELAVDGTVEEVVVSKFASLLHAVGQDKSFFSVFILFYLAVKVIYECLDVVGAPLKLPALLVAEGCIVEDCHDQAPTDLFAPVGCILQNFLSLGKKQCCLVNVALIG